MCDKEEEDCWEHSHDVNWTVLDCIKALCFYRSLCICLKLDRIKEEASIKVKDNCRIAQGLSK